MKRLRPAFVAVSFTLAGCSAASPDDAPSAATLTPAGDLKSGSAAEHEYWPACAAGSYRVCRKSFNGFACPCEPQGAEVSVVDLSSSTSSSNSYTINYLFPTGVRFVGNTMPAIHSIVWDSAETNVSDCTYGLEADAPGAMLASVTGVMLCNGYQTEGLALISPDAFASAFLTAVRSDSLLDVCNATNQNGTTVSVPVTLNHAQMVGYIHDYDGNPSDTLALAYLLEPNGTPIQTINITLTCSDAFAGL